MQTEENEEAEETGNAVIHQRVAVVNEVPSQSLWTCRKLLVFTLLSLVVFLTWACVGLLGAFFPNEANEFGVTDTATGFIFGMYPLVAFLSSLLYGTILIPKLGPYFILFTGLFLNGGAQILFGYVTLLPKGTVFAVFCFLIRAVGALGGSACETSVMVILVGEFRENLTTVVGSIELFNGLGTMIGPMIGGSLYTVGGFKAPFLVTGGLLLFSMPLMWCFLPRQKGNVVDNEETHGSIKKAISIPGVVIITVALCVSMLAFTYLDPTLARHAKKFGLGLNATEIGLLFLACSVTYVIFSPICGWICEKTGWYRSSLVFGILLSVSSQLFIGPAPFFTSFVPERQVWLISVALAVYGASGSFIFVPAIPEMLKCCYEKGLAKDVSTDSLISGLYSASSNLGCFFGPVLGGILMDNVGFEWTASAMAFLTLSQAPPLIAFAFCKRMSPSTAEERKRLLPA